MWAMYNYYKYIKIPLVVEAEKWSNQDWASRVLHETQGTLGSWNRARDTVVDHHRHSRSSSSSLSYTCMCMCMYKYVRTLYRNICTTHTSMTTYTQLWLHPMGVKISDASSQNGYICEHISLWLIDKMPSNRHVIGDKHAGGDEYLSDNRSLSVNLDKGALLMHIHAHLTHKHTFTMDLCSTRSSWSLCRYTSSNSFWKYVVTYKGLRREWKRGR